MAARWYSSLLHQVRYTRMIRKARNSDFYAILAIAKAMHADSQYAIHSFSDKVFRGTFDYAMTNGFVMVAESDDAIVGAGMAMYSPYMFSEDLIANDMGFYVLPAFRKGSVGVKLIKEYIKWAKELGCYEVQIGGSYGFNSNEDENLKKLLSAIGFSPAGEFHKKVL